VQRATIVITLTFLTAFSGAQQQHEIKRLADGRIVQPPSLIESPSATCPAGRSLFPRHKVVEIYLVVPDTGVPERIKVVRSAGKAFDDQAVAVVQKYRFRPATVEDKPVMVDLYMDVDFRC
jgi:periplasmic protein TonB